MTLVRPIVNAVSLLGLAHLAMPQMSPIASRRAASEGTVGRLFFFDASVGGRVASANDDGSDRIVIVNGCRIADAIVGDLEPRHFYWANIGVPLRTMVRSSPRTRWSGSQNHHCQRRHVTPRSGKRPPEILFRYLMERFGIALDFKGKPNAYHRSDPLNSFRQA